jgi:flagellar protein FlaG
MWNKENLSRVTEYRSKVGHVGSAAKIAATEVADDLGNAASNSKPTPAQLDPKAMQQALSNLSAHIQNLHRNLEFSVDKDSGDTVVKVIDTETKEVIRQIPSEELLAISQRLRSAAGVLLTEQV